MFIHDSESYYKYTAIADKCGSLVNAWDMHILRTLKCTYRNARVTFIAVTIG